MCLGCYDQGGPYRCSYDARQTVESKQLVRDDLAEQQLSLKADLALIEAGLLELDADPHRQHLDRTSKDLDATEAELTQAEESLPPPESTATNLDQVREKYAAMDEQELRDEIAARTTSPEFAALIAARDEARDRKKTAQEHFDAVSQAFSDDTDTEGLEALNDARHKLYDAHCDLQVANAPLEQYKDHTAQAAAELSERIDIPEWEGDRLGELYKHSEHPEGSREWLEDRQNGIGGSDVGVLTGEDKDAYRRSTDIKDSKLTPLSDDDVAAQAEDMANGTGPTGRGHAWERVIVADYAADHPEDSVLVSKATWRHPDREYVNVNVDGLLSSDGGENVDGVIDSKTGSDAEKFANGIPVGYRAQLGYYLRNAGLSRGVIAAKLDDGTTRYWTMKVDEPISGEPGGKTIADYDDKLASTWKKWQAEKQNPPGPRPNKSTFAWVKKPNSESSQEKNATIARDLAAYRGISQKRARQMIENNIYQGKAPDAAVRDLYTSYDPKADPNRRFVTIDFETNSRSAGKGEIIQTGVVVTDGTGKVLERIDELHGIDSRIRDLQGTGATDVHGIRPDDVNGKTKFESSATRERVRELLEHPHATLIAHNAQFEKNWLRANGIGAPRVIDTRRLRERFDHGTVGATNKDFCEANGVAYENAHNAAADSDMTSRAFHNFTKRLLIDA